LAYEQPSMIILGHTRTAATGGFPPALPRWAVPVLCVLDADAANNASRRKHLALANAM
jgi:hypothetical protein